MSRISRRAFCASVGALFGSAAVSKSAVARSFAANTEKINVAQIDRQRILTAAQRYLNEEPITITASSSPRSAGGKHDYFSEGDYWWPDPKNPDGPYIQRDGLSNPNNFADHRRHLILQTGLVQTRSAAYRINDGETYAAKAAPHPCASVVCEA